MEGNSLAAPCCCISVSGVVLALKIDTNSFGTIFGGVLPSYIDQAGSVGAIYETERNGWLQNPLVTVAMNAVEFHEPVFVGDVVSFGPRVGVNAVPINACGDFLS